MKNNKLFEKHAPVAVIGLGYVGLPLAIEFGKICPTIGFDIDNERISSLRIGLDQTLEIDEHEFNASTELVFTSNLDDIERARTYIVTVPTPIDEHKRPDLRPLINASKAIGTVLKKGDVVIYESTVYPGATEDDCVPILENVSGLKFNVDFVDTVLAH